MAKEKKQKKPEFNLNAALNDPNTKVQIRGFVEEIGKLKLEQKSAGEAIKSIKTEAGDSLGIPGKILNNLVKEWMTEGSIDGEIHVLEEVKQIHDALKQ